MKKLFLVLLGICLTTVSCKKVEVVPTPSNTKIEQPTVESIPTTNDKVDRNLMTGNAEEYGITHESYPKIDGSTSTLEVML